ncbi:hypothetical protein ABZ553_09155 [Streptomyces sparsogenes]|uniref:hypothetical protein n=1 Tax=Streptomyces sparsogenes TaxID=67365 RepID=UPI0034083F7B
MTRTKKALVTLAIAGAAAFGTAGSTLAASGHDAPAATTPAQAQDTLPQATPLDEALPAPLPN